MKSKSSAMRQVALKRLGRKKPSGMFKKIAAKASKKYKSKKIGNKVAGSIYWAKVNAKKHSHAGVLLSKMK